jgi:chromosome segregation ATPase
MATVEEIVVRFTGDATSLEQASTRARMKTRDLEQEILSLNRVMERNKSTTSAQELNLAKLEKTTAKYLDTLEKIHRAMQALRASQTPEIRQLPAHRVEDERPEDTAVIDGEIVSAGTEAD